MKIVTKIPFPDFGSVPITDDEVDNSSTEHDDTVVAPLELPAEPQTEPTSDSSSTTWLHHIPETSPLLQIGLMMLLSIGLHGLTMLIPWVNQKKVETVKPGEKKVRITQLPPVTKPGSPKPSVAKTPINTTTPPPLKPPTIKPSVVVANKPVIPFQPKPIPSAASPKPIPSATPKAKTPQASPSPKPEPSKVVASPSPKPEPSKVVESPSPKPEEQASSSWDDFPKFPNAQGGCNNVSSCQQTTADISAVASFFERELSAKQYENKSTEASADRKVYQISRGGLVQYLTILNAAGKGAQYVLAPEPFKMADFNNVAEVPAEVGSILAEAGGTDATRSSFASPDNFFIADKTRPEIADIKVIKGIDYSDCFDTYFRTNLLNKGFESTQTPTPYGGGLLYTAQKDQVTLIINLVPTPDGNDTAVVVWRRMPT